VRFRVCSLFGSVGNGWLFNLRSGGALWWKAEDRRLGRTGSVLCKDGTSKVVAPACVS
jgi:hypothetical protein